MQEIRHNADAIRYIYGGPEGLLEFRAFICGNEVADVLIFHRPDCDGEHCNEDCDCEFTAGQEIAIAWELAADDRAVWSELARRAVAADLADVPQPPREPSADQRAFTAGLRAEGEQMVGDGHFRAVEPVTVDLSNVPQPLVDAAKAAIVRCWVDGASLEDAIVAAGTQVYQSALANGCDPAQAERLGMAIAAVGAHMQAGINPTNYR